MEYCLHAGASKALRNRGRDLHRFFVPNGGTSAIESARWEGNLFWLVLLSISAYSRASVVLTDDVSVELKIRSKWESKYGRRNRNTNR